MKKEYKRVEIELFTLIQENVLSVSVPVLNGWEEGNDCGSDDIY